MKQNRRLATKKPPPPTCAAGYPLPRSWADPCEYCGATENDICRLADETLRDRMNGEKIDETR